MAEILKPRIIFIDLHCNDFLVRHYSRIRSGNLVTSFKHRLLLNYFVKNGYEVCNLITPDGTRRGGRLMQLPFTKTLEARYVEYKNGISKHKILSISDIKENDIVIGYFVYKYQLDILKSLNCYKVLFGNHFISANIPVDLQSLGINSFVNEIDLSNNEFVNKYFYNSSIDSIVLPYTFQKRFVPQRLIEDRDNKMMAVGTSSTCSIVPNEYKLYRDFFKTELIQPLRQEIYKKRDQLTEWIDCYISSILDDNGNQTKYTSFDMVETFNKYKMFACPEELVGMPGIGFVEGMACGTAYIGLDHEMYKSLGLIPGYHYITYDGTLNDMIRVIKEYKQKPDELKLIAERGCEFVRSHFNEEVVGKSFEAQLLESYMKYIGTCGSTFFSGPTCAR